MTRILTSILAVAPPLILLGLLLSHAAPALADGQITKPDVRDVPLAVAKQTPQLREHLQSAALAGDLKKLHRVIVALEREQFPVGGKAMTLAARDPVRMATFRSFVRDKQRSFLTSLSDSARARVIRQYDNIPALALELTADEIEAATLDAQVSTIERMEVYQTVNAESHPLAGIDLAHGDNFRGQGITVAVIDDGIQADHPAFGSFSGFPTPKIIGGFDFADNDSDPRNDCVGQSHGTSVAGIVAGDGGGVTGVAPDASLVALKIQSASICGQSALDGDLVGAIDWAVTNRDTYNIGALSMSLSGGTFSTVSGCENSSPSLTNVLNLAESIGIVAFAASGNDGLCEQMSRPGCVGSVISVGATYDADLGNPGYCVSPNSCAPTQFHPSCAPAGLEAAFEGTTFSDKVTVYSNSASFLDLLAPSNCAFTSTTGSGTTSCFGGTSAATPFAAGAGALALQAGGGVGTLDTDEVRAALGGHGVDVTDSRNGRVTPRLDAFATITALSAMGPEVCDDGVDNDNDGAIDCGDGDCAGDPVCSVAESCLFDATFSGGSDSFVFVDDAQDPAYTAGAASGDSLTVSVGGVDDADIVDMLGGWRRDCTLSSATDVTITVVADLTQTSAYESDELSEVRLRVNDSTFVLATVIGDGNGGPPQSTGVQTYTTSTFLPAGANAVALGCFNNQKTFNDEETDCEFFGVTVEPSTAPACTVDDSFEAGTAGWINSGASTCSTGAYVVGTPTQIVNGGVTTQVGGANSGTNAIFTATNSSAGVNDVDGGNCILDSPTYSVSSASALSIAYFHGQRDSGDDASGDFFALEISTDNGTTYQTIADNGDVQSNATWGIATTAIPANSEVRVRVQCSDGAGPGDLVECGVDDLQICPD